ncbi:hypothetical protein BGZ99_008680 [Dissophora globulifera]|uniref:Uncharacterized protein n=1 Tax=Dissophora globulifera TaxID=979702 RepID=A0A9P6UP48_9FUNG|nr:hypothetical protein BGZ99_008680 [Dissophora globulifera]
MPTGFVPSSLNSPADRRTVPQKLSQGQNYPARTLSAGVDDLAVEGLSIQNAPLPHQQYPPPQMEHLHPNHQQQQPPYPTSVHPSWQQQQQQQQPLQQQQHQPQAQAQPQQQQQRLQKPSQVRSTITATITTNGDQTRTIAFEEAQRQNLAKAKKSSQLPPNVAAQVLTKAQQREAEADAYIQRGIELHEEGQLEQATYYFGLAAKSENPLGQLMYGLSLRHGWGCAPNPKEAIIYLQRAAAFAMNELKELMPGSHANIKAIQHQQQQYQQQQQRQQQQQQQNTSAQFFQPQPLQRMGTIDRQSALLTARRELVMALYELGMSFLKGWGVQKDRTTAFHYFKLAADLGDADSQNETGQCFLDGVGTDKNVFEAARYFRLASSQGASQFGDSWIWKPKYDQYCKQHAAAAAAEAATRKGDGSSQAGSTGLGSMTAGAKATSTDRRHHSQNLKQSGSADLAAASGRAADPLARPERYNLAGDLISSSQLELKVRQAERLTKATVGPVLDNRESSASQDSPTGKKHRWSLWGLRHRHDDNQHRRVPSSS